MPNKTKHDSRVSQQFSPSGEKAEHRKVAPDL